jgi:cAMP receptor-like G-protein coupled receptor
VLCQVQAATIQFFVIASYGWSFSVALALYVLFNMEEATEASTRRMMPFFHVVNWGYPLITVILCFIFEKFGPAGPWCWVKGSDDPFRLFVYAPLLILLFVMSGLFIAIRVKLSSMQASMTRNLQRRLSFYLLAFLVSQLPAAVNRAQNFFDPRNPQLWLFVIQAIFQPLQGFFNALVYGSTDVFMEQWRMFFRRVCCTSCRLCCNRFMPALFGDDDITRHMSRGDQSQSLVSRPERTGEVPSFDYDYDSGDDGIGGIN